MDQSNFQKELIESEEAFIDQFNRDSAQFHNGITVPVPVGGQRVPDSMPTMYPDKDLGDYLNQQPQDYGPQYDQCMQYKTFMTELKKTLNSITMSQEALLRNQDLLAKSDVKQQAKLHAAHENEINTLTTVLATLTKQIDYLTSQPKYKDRYKDLGNVIQLSQKKYNSKEELFDFYQVVKNITSLIFKDNQLLTEEIKQIKKQHQQQQK